MLFQPHCIITVHRPGLEGVQMNGADLRSIQEALGYTCIKTTEKYTHLVQSMRGKLVNPLDGLDSGTPM